MATKAEQAPPSSEVSGSDCDAGTLSRPPVQLRDIGTAPENRDDYDDRTGREALIKTAWRLLPLLFLGYGIAYMDRVNVGFAALRMNQDLHFSASVYGLGGGLFFLSYAFCEIPSNLLLVRFGARRWLARIMLTWGVIAVGMMFVRTPLQFYCMRFLLGLAEAGFFPGVLFYLTQWFPKEYRGRMISRFYFAGPLAVAVMGAVAGGLLSLQGRLGLAGWQWLFLVQGMPAIVLGAIIFKYLRDGPLDASWLTEIERTWIVNRLTAERAAQATQGPTRIITVLRQPVVWRLSMCNVLIMGSNYSLILSAPLLLRSATHWSATRVGFVVSGAAFLGALAMLINGLHSDRSHERHLHAVLPMSIYGLACLNMAIWSAPTVVVICYMICVVATWANQAVFWLIPSDNLHGRAAAIGLAAIGSIGMIGAFIGPYAWGLAQDSTGSYKAGVFGLAVAYSCAAAIMLFIRHNVERTSGPMCSVKFR